jgi:subtilisin family serine protease
MPPQKHRPSWQVILLLLIILILLLTLGIVCYRCKCPKHCTNCKTDTIPWVSWNIQFNNDASSITRAQVTEQVIDSLLKYLVANGIDTLEVRPLVRPHFCPCDTTLVNVDIALINESGNPVTPPGPVTTTTPKTVGAGGSVYASAPNTPITIPEFHNAGHLPDPTLTPPDSIKNFKVFQPNSGLVLAVIDTGLDSIAVKNTLKMTKLPLVWRDPSAKPTLYNFLVDADPSQMKDDETSFMHGTSVTYISLLAGSANYPRIMALKALDSLGRGSVFTVSCAMSYALQNKVNMINASLGYSGNEDTILRRYFKRADSMKIPVIVAAGNDTSRDHNDSLLCQDIINHSDSLDKSNPFYPAFFSEQMHNVISVTGVNSDTLPCYYQNFSRRHIDIGVWILATSKRSAVSCCSFFIPYLKGGEYVEGSSFSTPIVSGTLMNILANEPATGNGSPPTFDPKDWLNLHAPKAKTLQPYVRSGKFIPYSY